MPDREKVIDALNRCTLQGKHSGKMHQEACAACLYRRDRKCNFTTLMKDALELLKEQEPVKPIIKTQKLNGEIIKYYGCGICKTPLPKTFRFCQMCGRKVKWDADD